MRILMDVISRVEDLRAENDVRRLVASYSDAVGILDAQRAAAVGTSLFIAC
jgi:hypothetical protein